MNNLTLHIVSDIPWSNLNRDDTGLPKRMKQGGVSRGLLSSQSIKRGARVRYEAKTLDLTVRSTNLGDVVCARALEINPEIDEAKAKAAANKSIRLLNAKSDSDDAKKSSVWMSAEEIETLAANIAADGGGAVDFIEEGRTGSLAIAAFGRMFANQPDLTTEAAIAVSPAVATHLSLIETDYFTTADESRTAEQGRGAGHVGVAHYTSGVFYRTVTIDRNQLKRTWTGFDAKDVETKLSQLVTSLIYGMPRGKENSTAPFVTPVLVLAEAQDYRTAYNFDHPVLPGRDGGYVTSTVEELARQFKAARGFDSANFGDLQVIAGTAEGLDIFGIPMTDRQGLADQVAQWILEA